ncbi:hypothetical protein Tco_1495230 [Tanacetum coccineum]|uniref:Uncharacterized protein n=1 Tax=Tanacetum coccineum TaxID=301880 RepID=A0ABQ5FUJ1_9ASTR
MVYIVNGVLANGVDMVLEKDFAGFALQEMEIHPLMLLIQTLSIILQTFSPTLHNLVFHNNILIVKNVGVLMKIINVNRGIKTTLSLTLAMILIPYGFDQPPQYSIDHHPQEDLNQQRMNDVHNKWDDTIESRNELLQSLGEMLRQQEQVANLSTHTPKPSRRFNSIYYDDDDDDDDDKITIPLN